MSKILAQGMITLTQLYEGAQVILTPAAVLIPCDSEENPKSNAYINASTNVKAFLGTMDITSGITLGELEYSDSTVRASKTETRVSITAITTRTGYVDIPVSATINGEIIDLGKHRFSFVKQIDGQTGQPGAPGDPGFGYTLNIKGGTRGIAYAANGTNPEPNTSSQFSVELLKNGVKVSNPASISWTCGGNLSGVSSVATFTPAIKSTYASGSSYVKVSVKEFAASLAVEETIPIICTKHADGLDWINEWNNQYVQVGTEKIITPKIFAGTKNSANELTGVAIGRDVLGGNANKVIGIVGYKKNTPVFSLDQDANFFVSSSGSAGDIKNGTNNAKGLYFDGNNLYISGKVKISGGSTIGESNTLVEDVINNSNLGAQANNKLDNLQIGGRNLQRNTEFKNDLLHWNAGAEYSRNTSKKFDGSNTVYFTRTGLAADNVTYLFSGNTAIQIEVGQTVTASANFFADNVSSIDGGKAFIGIWFYDAGGSSIASSRTTIPFVNGKWVKCSHTATAPANTVYCAIVIGTNRNGSYYIGKPMFEKGNKATDWSPAPEDIDSAIGTKANASDVYNKTEVYTKAETNSQINVAKNEINLGVSKIEEISKITSIAKVMNIDVDFRSGLNGISTYNNAGNGNVVLSRVAKSSECPTKSTHMIQITTSGSASPGHGGFTFETSSRANAVFITKFLAKIPSGYSLSWHSNPTGDGSKHEWLTSTAGTGKWTEYICKVTCGASGSFSSTNFFALNGGSAPVTWYLGMATVYDLTDSNQIERRMESAEQKITPTAIINTVNTQIGEGGEINTVSTVLNKEGLTVNNGALRVKNKSGSTVLSGDSNGNLVLAGNITSNATISGGTIKGGIIQNNSTVIDNTGLTVNNGAIKIKNKAGNTVLSGDSNGNLTLSGTIKSEAGNGLYAALNSGGITFRDSQKSEEVLRIGTSFSNGNRDINGVTFAMPQYSDRISFRHIAKPSLENGWDGNETTYGFMEMWSGDYTGPNGSKNYKGVNVFAPMYLSQKIRFRNGGDQYLHEVTPNITWNNMDKLMGIYGDNGTVIGYKSADSLYTRIVVTEGNHPGTGDNIKSWGNWNCSGYTVHNATFSGNHVNSYANTTTRTVSNTAGVMAEGNQVRVNFENIQIKNGKAILSIPKRYRGINEGYIIASIVKKGRGDVWVSEEEEERFIIEAENDIKINIEIIIKLTEAVVARTLKHEDSICYEVPNEQPEGDCC